MVTLLHAFMFYSCPTKQNLIIRKTLSFNENKSTDMQAVNESIKNLQIRTKRKKAVNKRSVQITFFKLLNYTIRNVLPQNIQTLHFIKITCEYSKLKDTKSLSKIIKGNTRNIASTIYLTDFWKALSKNTSYY